MEKQYIEETKRWADSYGYGSGLAEKLGISNAVLSKSYADGLSFPMVSLMTAKCTPRNIEFFIWYGSRVSIFRSVIWEALAEEIGFDIDILVPVPPSPINGASSFQALTEKFGVSSERKLEKRIGVGRSTINNMKDPTYPLPPISIWPICNALEIDPIEGFLAAVRVLQKDRTSNTSDLIDLIWANVLQKRQNIAP